MAVLGLCARFSGQLAIAHAELADAVDLAESSIAAAGEVLPASSLQDSPAQRRLRAATYHLEDWLHREKRHHSMRARAELQREWQRDGAGLLRR